MTEAEILTEIAVHGDRIWAIMQYWTSVCFGLLIAAHLTAARVSGYVIAIFLILYSIFTFQLMTMLRFDMKVIQAGIMELERLADSGETLGLTAQAVVENGPVAHDTWYTLLLRRVTGVGMFIATIAYPIYCHRKANR